MKRLKLTQQILFTFFILSLPLLKATSANNKKEKCYQTNLVIHTTESLNSDQMRSLQDIVGNQKVTQFYPQEIDGILPMYEVLNVSSCLINELKQNENVLIVEEDHSAEPYEIRPNPQSEMLKHDLLYHYQWGLHAQNQIISTFDSNTRKVEKTATKDIEWKDVIQTIESNLSQNPVVAVIDMGIDLNHKDLVNNIAKNDAECENGNIQAPGQNGVREDRDRNGFPGDCMGWNFAAENGDRLFEAYPIDDTGHGTHVSGIIAAKSNNNYAISGVSDKIKILPIKVTGRVDETNDRNKLRYRSASRRIAKAIFYATFRKVDVINLSLGWPRSMDTLFMRNAINFALSRGVIIVAAAGNNNTEVTTFPCSYEGVLCVGSHDSDGSYSSFTNFNGAIDVLAPGNQILSTIPEEFIPLKMNIQGVDIMSGTSQAAPYVSAIAALLKYSYNETLSPIEIKRRIIQSAYEVPQSDRKYSLKGAVSLKKAYELQPSSYIIPIFKGLENPKVRYNKNTSKHFFFTNLKFQNLGLPHGNTSIRIKSLSKGIELAQSDFDVKDHFSKGPELSINVLHLLENLDIDSTYRFQIEVLLKDDENNILSTHQYQHELYLEVDLRSAQNKEVMPIKFNNNEKHRLIGLNFELKDSVLWNEADLSPELRQAWLRRNKADENSSSNLQSMTYPMGTNTPWFFLSKRLDSKTFEIFFFEMINNEILEKKKSLKFENTERILSIKKMDFNYDGQEDILIQTISIYENKMVAINYFYYDLDLNPLFGDKSHFMKLENSNSISVDNKSTRFIKKKIIDTNGETSFVALEAFIQRAYLPEKDQVNNYFEKQDRSIKSRLYILEPTWSEKDKAFILDVRSFMNEKFRKKIITSYSKSFPLKVTPDDIDFETIGNLAQTEDDFYNSQITSMISIGVGFQRLNLTLNTKGLKTYELQKQESKSKRLLGHTHHNTLNADAFLNTFVSFISQSKAQVTIDSPMSQETYTHRLSFSDRLVNFIASYETTDLPIFIYETIDKIVAFKGHEMISKRAVQKFSFLPGSIMSDVFMPIQNKNKSVALYIDTSLIAQSRLQVLKLKNDEFISPIKYSIHVPEICGVEDNGCGLQTQNSTFYCKGLNPYNNKTGDSYMHILCKNKDNFELHRIRINL